MARLDRDMSLLKSRAIVISPSVSGHRAPHPPASSSFFYIQLRGDPLTGSEKSLRASAGGRITLVLGHAASGKSAWAEAQVAALGAPLTYVATAALWDGEMREKARDHAARRGPDWRLVERPDDLAACCATLDGPVLIDCATMWLTDLFMQDRDWKAPADAWIGAMAASQATFHVVSNDVGGGITPDNVLARRFQRAQGALNQRLAAAADRVVLVTAGLPQVLK